MTGRCEPTTMRVGAPFGRLLQELVIDPARPRHRAFPLGRQIDGGDNGVERFLRALRLLLVEIHRHIFHERGWNDRLHIDQPQDAAAHLRQLERLLEPLGIRRLFGEIDCENDALVHDDPPSGMGAPARAPSGGLQRYALFAVWQAGEGRGAAFTQRQDERALVDDSHCSFADRPL